MRFELNNQQIAVASPQKLNCDTRKTFGEMLNIYKGLFSIAVITAPLYGAGDLSFGIKFINHLLQRYGDMQIEILFFIPQNPQFEKIVLQQLPGVVSVTNPDGNSKEGNSSVGKVKLLLANLHEESVFSFPIQIKADIAFIAPGTSVRNFYINFTYALWNKTYILSEYNISKNFQQSTSVEITEVSINTGVYDEIACEKISNLCPTGIFLAEDKNYPRMDFIPPGRHYAITYVYTSIHNVGQLYLHKKEKTGSEIQKVLQNSRAKHIDPETCEDAGTTWKMGMAAMYLCFYNFLGEVEKYRKENRIADKIIIYVKGSFMSDFRAYLSLERRYNASANTTWMLMTDPKSPFEFLETPQMTMKEMLGFFQHAIPIAFISGDNTPAEFISVNRSPIIKLAYAAFYWKRALAVALGVNFSDQSGYNACGIATIFRDKFLANVANNFDIAGMEQVENLMIDAIASIDPAQDCANTDFHTITTRSLTTNHFMYESTLLDNPMTGNTLQFELKDDPFDTNYIRGNIKPIGGGTASDVAITSWAKNREENIFVKFIGCELNIYNCNSFVFNLQDTPYITVDGTKIMPLPQCLSTIMISNLINKAMKQETLLQDFLIYTYASVLNKDECGSAQISRKMRKKQDQGGIFLVQKYIPKAEMFRDLFRCQALSERDFKTLFVQLTWTLYTLQNLFGFVHNDLWAANVIVENIGYIESFKLEMYGYTFEFESQFRIRLIDVDNAAYNIEDNNRFLSLDAWNGGKTRSFNDHYDLAYFLGDLWVIITSQEDGQNGDWLDNCDLKFGSNNPLDKTGLANIVLTYLRKFYQDNTVLFNNAYIDKKPNINLNWSPNMKEFVKFLL